MATTLTSTGITFPDSTTKTTAEIYQSMPESASLPGASAPLYICTGLGNNLKFARFSVASATTNGGPASIGIAIKMNQSTANSVAGYHTRITGTTLSSSSISFSGQLVFLIPPSGSYQVPRTWDVSLYRRQTSGTVQTHQYVLEYTASTSNSLYIGQMYITGPYTGGQTYITDIGIYNTFGNNPSGTASGIIGVVENY